jgi:hypothetical protein
MTARAATASPLDTARLAIAEGISVLPIKSDGSKRPLLDSWKHLQDRIATPDELDRWFSGGNAGLAMVGGNVSGGIEVLDFDDADTWEAFEEAANRLGCGELLQRIRDGYEEITPSGGAHLVYRCSQIAGNTKLAMRINAANPRQRDVLIETRGEGGYAITAPSNGGTHPSGNAWKLVSGGVDSIGTITPAERQILHDLCRSFDEVPEALEARGTHQKRELDPSLPGDDFRFKHGDLGGWRTILEPHGWRYLFTRSDGTAYWQRPGKDEPGWSATTGHAGTDYLYVFTSSTSFEPNRAYSPFAAYSHLAHDGDYSAAAAELTQRGYGSDTAIPHNCISEVGPGIDRRACPTDCLPGPLRQLANEAEATLGVPSDFIATAGLAVLGSAIGNALELHIKPGWTEVSTLYTAFIGDPGSAKSPAIKLATEPLEAIQTELKTAWQSAMQLWEDTPKQDRGNPPDMAVVQTTDTTIEGLAKLLDRTRGILCANDELTSWVSGHNRYRGSNASERGQWLSLWTGKQIVVTRISKPTMVIERPVACVTGGIQPDTLYKLASDRPGDFSNDGMFDRFLITWPNRDPASWTEEQIGSSTLTDWTSLVRRLWKWQPRDRPGSFFIGPRFGVTQFSQESRSIWKRWFDANVQSIKSASGPTKGWASKAPTHLARLSLILHGATNPDDPERDIEPSTLESAIELTEWFREQHGIMLTALKLGSASTGAGLPSRILRVVRNLNSAGAWATRTDIRYGLGNPAAAGELTEVLDALVATGELDRQIVRTGARPREEYALPNRKYADMHLSLPESSEEANLHICISEVESLKQRTSWVCTECGASNAAHMATCAGCILNRQSADPSIGKN